MEEMSDQAILLLPGTGTQALQAGQEEIHIFHRAEVQMQEERPQEEVRLLLQMREEQPHRVQIRECSRAEIQYSRRLVQQHDQ